MPAEELFTLADRWRRDPTGAAQDGQLLAATRAALASLDTAERSALGEQLRTHGASELADRLEVSDRLPVWSDEFTAVARDVLTVDAATLQDLRQAASDTLSDLPAPAGEPVELPPPPVDASPVDELAPPADDGWRQAPADGEQPADDAAPADDGQPAGDHAPPPADDGWRQAPANDPPAAAERDPAPAGAPAWQARRWQPRGPQASSPRAPSAPRFDATGAATARALHGAGEVESLAPGVRSSVVARTRFAQLADLVAEGVTPDAAERAITEAPDGWQRRRVILRLLDAGPVELDAAAVLGSLARAADRTTVADRLVRHGAATVDEVVPYLTTSAAARLHRRHG